MSLREQGKEQRRSRILQAVVGILSEEGMSGLTTARIAERAELSVATLYNLIGSIDDILDLLVQSLFEDFKQLLGTSPDHEDPARVFDDYIDAAWRFMGSNEAANRAALKAIFNINVSRGKSLPVVEVTHGGRDFLAGAIADCQRQGLLKTTASPALLAEQMVFAQSILLESWAAGFISLERFRLSCRYHFWSLLRAWADRKLVARADKLLLELQQDIETLDRARQRTTSRRKKVTV